MRLSITARLAASRHKGENRRPNGRARTLAATKRKHSRPAETSQTVWRNIKAVCFPPTARLLLPRHAPFVNEDATSCWPPVVCRKRRKFTAALRSIFFFKEDFLPERQCVCSSSVREEGSGAENQSMSRGLYCWVWNHFMFHLLQSCKE